MIEGPNPNDMYPIQGNNKLQFIKPSLTRANIEAGEYSYYDSKNGESFEEQVLYHYEIIGDKLTIGKFCSIGPGTIFIMNGANHRMDGSTFPFNIFGHGWEKHTPTLEELPIKGDTHVGNDVWIGRDVTIMPGVKIGDGAIIATGAIVTGDVQPYSIFGGNPARMIKKRFPEETINELLQLKWWDFNIDEINKNIKYIVNGEIEILKRNLRNNN